MGELFKRDNQLLRETPTEQEVKMTINKSNIHAATGWDGISFYLYQHYWDTIGDILTEVVQQVFSGLPPTKSQQT